MDRMTTHELDDLDRRLILALADDPRCSVMELTRRLEVARGTVQSRLDKLASAGALSFGPLVDPKTIGYAVEAFTSIEIAQGRLTDVVNHLLDIPEVLEAHATTGESDLHCRIVARTNEHLQEVVNRILEVKGINRTTTVIALSTQIDHRVLPLVRSTGR